VMLRNWRRLSALCSGTRHLIVSLACVLVYHETHTVRFLIEMRVNCRVPLGVGLMLGHLVLLAWIPSVFVLEVASHVLIRRIV
jgi:hypothetical protein